MAQGENKPAFDKAKVRKEEKHESECDEGTGYSSHSTQVFHDEELIYSYYSSNTSNISGARGEVHEAVLEGEKRFLVLTAFSLSGRERNQLPVKRIDLAVKWQCYCAGEEASGKGESETAQGESATAQGESETAQRCCSLQ